MVKYINNPTNVYKIRKELPIAESPFTVGDLVKITAEDTGKAYRMVLTRAYTTSEVVFLEFHRTTFTRNDFDEMFEKDMTETEWVERIDNEWKKVKSEVTPECVKLGKEVRTLLVIGRLLLVCTMISLFIKLGMDYTGTVQGIKDILYTIQSIVMIATSTVLIAIVTKHRKLKELKDKINCYVQKAYLDRATELYGEEKVDKYLNRS